MHIHTFHGTWKACTSPTKVSENGLFAKIYWNAATFSWFPVSKSFPCVHGCFMITRSETCINMSCIKEAARKISSIAYYWYRVWNFLASLTLGLGDTRNLQGNYCIGVASNYCCNIFICKLITLYSYTYTLHLVSYCYKHHTCDMNYMF